MAHEPGQIARILVEQSAEGRTMNRYAAWLALLDQRDRVMVNLFLMAAMAMAYYLLLIRGNKMWGRVALVGGGIAFYGSLLAFYLIS
jgi:hypothetical protein